MTTPDPRYVERVLAAVRALDAQALAAIPSKHRGHLYRRFAARSPAAVELAAVHEALGIEAGDE